MTLNFYDVMVSMRTVTSVLVCGSVSVTSSRIAPSCLKSLLHPKSGGAVRCRVNRAPRRAPKTKLMGADARRRTQQTQRGRSGTHSIRFESRPDPGYRWMCACSISCTGCSTTVWKRTHNTGQRTGICSRMVSPQ